MGMTASKTEFIEADPSVSLKVERFGKTGPAIVPISGAIASST
jgi:hypothetical protein